MKKVSFITLGCKVNQYETQSFRESFIGGPYEEAQDSEAADIYVVNACVVTHRAERESRSVIRRALRKNPNARVIATGCLTAKSKSILAEIAQVTLVGNEEKNQVPFITKALPMASVPTPSSVQGMRISGFGGRARAFVKVQDGCALNCTFCIIPTVRGGLRSRRVADIRAEVEDLASNGYREIVLTGVHLGHFGRGKGETERFDHLLAELSRVEGIDRIRLSSIESVELKPNILDVLCGHPKFVPHFHLPLQSGNDRILSLMKRRYTVSEFMAGVEDLWRRFERPSLSTDVIIGFPGETDSDFRDTLKIMREAGFGRSHVFSYSDREGTAAAAMKPKTPSRIIKARTSEAIELGNRLAWRYSKLFLGQIVEVLVEKKEKNGLLSGYSERYVRVQFSAAEGRAMRGEIVSVRITEVDEKGEAMGDFVAQGKYDRLLTSP
jgi:threonylcarbamoyladenosine tRNA methylthiotransferase MtaB